ncbi:MAG: SusD/RagB family nutrient-binding outer membrane lipoprotein [Muribaculaceae bacterium]|nr:SusD/RagB family nutrient-binding outer membrane lipoprotein [Muribaculaceae bacterium]
MTLIAAGAASEQDPRLTTWATRYSNADDWKGTTAGCEPADQQIDTQGCAMLNYEVFVRDDAPDFLMDYSEVQFILAEAALKGWIAGGDTKARIYYEQAVTASCMKWAELEQFSNVKAPIDNTAITKFLGGRLAGWDNNTDKEKLIAEQKFLSLFWTGMEAYHEIRRTGWPQLTIGEGAFYNDWHLPQRMGYPSTTVGSNPDNVNAAQQNMGGINDMLTPVWWSYKAIHGDFREIRPAKASN